MNKTIIAVIVVAIIAVGGYFLLIGPQPSAPSTGLAPQSSSEQTTPKPSTTQETPANSQNQVTPTEPPTPPVTTKPEAQTLAQSFTVNGNDSGADLTTITVPKGTPVTITFGADANGTYHGGLDFRSSVVNTGTIAPGSTKTVSFTAEQSFVFTPYWPSTNIAKPYKINIVVQY